MLFACLPHAVNDGAQSTFPDQSCVAGSVDHSRGYRKHHSHEVHNGADPCECQCRVYHSVAQQFLTADIMDHSEIAFHGDTHQINNGPVNRTPDTDFTQYTQPVAKRPRQINVAQLQRVNYNEEQATAKIEHVLVEYQYVFLVLF